MDKFIEPNILKRRKRKLLIKYIFSTLILLVIILILKSYFKESVDRDNISIDVAEYGSMTNTISTIGNLNPEFEEVVISPVNSTLKRVNFSEGIKVNDGDTIIILNTDELKNKILDEYNLIELEKNKINQLKLNLRKKSNDLRVQEIIKSLEIENLESNKVNAEKLYKIGGGTQNEVKKIENELKISLLEKDKLKKEIFISLSTQKSSLKEANISLKIHQQALNNLIEKLNKSFVRAPRKGVITYVFNNIGDKVSQGDIILRIADLSSYMVRATISDSYAEKILLGQEIFIQIGEQKYYGKISSINPEIKDNEISFNIKLDKTYEKIYKPKMQVDVYIVTNRKEHSLRVHNGTSFVGSKSNELYIMDGENIAKKTKVEIGLSNNEYVEIKKGVKPGDKVIISGLETIRRTDEIKIND